MEQLDPETDGATPDLVEQNIETLRTLFPEAFTENSDPDGPRWNIDFDSLREILGDYVEDKDERYGLNWSGKSQARRLAQTPSMGTLRPCPSESSNWTNTKNLFIEGENLEVLKLLQKSYHKLVKLIYIDPPYNTGHEDLYVDDYADNLQQYLASTKQKSSQGLMLSSNPETAGRYHTNWLNMMYPRLKLARNMLREDGSICISVDDHEYQNMKMICNEIFGEENFIATIIWRKVFSPKNSAKYFSTDHDYILVYARRRSVWRPNLLPRDDEADERYTNPDNDPRGPWTSSDLTGRNPYNAGSYEVVSPTGKRHAPPSGRYWTISEDKFYELDKDDRIWWGESQNNMPRLKRFKSEVKEGMVPQTIWDYTEVGHTQEAKRELIRYVTFSHNENVLNSVKPTRLLRYILRICTNVDQGDLVFDFFAGSAPFGHATFLQNVEDNGNRRFILVQLPEPLKREEEHLDTIADLGLSRLRKASSELKSSDNDLGFKYFRLDASNIRPWDVDIDSLDEDLFDAVQNIKPDRSEQDVLYELLLKYGLDLAVPIEERDIQGKSVYVIGGGALIVCLADDIQLDVVEGIAELKAELDPEIVRVVFKDAGFADDVVKTNAVQILNQAGIDDVKSL